MYDNINFYLDSPEVDYSNLLEEVLQNGDNIIVEKRGLTNSDIPFAYISIEGKNNQKLSFKVTPFRISLMGKNSSICKFYLGDNFQTLSLKQFNDAINEISVRLGVNVKKARVSRIDVAHNFYMNYSPSTYHNCLIYLSRFQRGDINGNLYFKTSRVELNFYDKKKEYREKRLKIPDEFKDVENVLRYEIRFKKNVSKVFGRAITVHDLCSESFFNVVFQKWQDYYWKITKNNPILFESETSTFKTKDFRNYFMVQGVESTGGISYAYKLIDESKKAKSITKHNAVYLKTILDNAYKETCKSSKYDFTEELNEKMMSFSAPV